MSWPIVNLAVAQDGIALILDHHLYIAVAMDLAHRHAGETLLQPAGYHGWYTAV